MDIRKIVIVLIFVAGVIACHKNDMEYFPGFQAPGYFPSTAYHFNTNEITAGKFALGKKLFNDPILSSNNTISCSSCHIQTSGFTHHGHSVSHGIFDRLGTRNTPAIMNLAWSNSFMWDGGIYDLDLQPIAPITNHTEMDDSVVNVLARLRASNVYPGLFKQAFGSSEITTDHFFKALSQFMLMCVSANAKYDSVKRQQAVFTPEEAAGYSVFQQKCNACHREPLFTDHSFRNNGLNPGELNDKGRYMITLKDTDQYKFKVPSLRNLDYTPPYMHDGRFFTIDAVLDHYTGQVKQTPNLDPLLDHDGQAGIALTTEERNNLLSFLKTLNDRNFVINPMLMEK